LAIHLTDDAAAQLDRLAGRLAGGPPIARVLVFHTAESSTSGARVRLARERLGSILPQADFAGGTNAYFCQLNRDRPDIAAMDAVTYSINPQVHAFDETSLVETLAAQAETVHSARLFCGDRRIVISPVTLKPRFNPNATGPELSDPNMLPAPVDARQPSLFAAGWTLGSIKSLAESAVDSVTYYETTGWRGVMELAEGSPRPDLFRSLPGAVFPMYHVFADLAEVRGGELLACRSNDPLSVEGLAIRHADALVVLLANFTPRRQRIMILGLPPGPARLRVLDASNGISAMTEPARYRSETRVTEGSTIELPPYATAQMRWQR
jgi:hypothetical protein